MIRITDAIELDEVDLDERFVRASGPGGQNVNKVATAVELRVGEDRVPPLTRIVTAFDCGRIVNPEALRNQVLHGKVTSVGSVAKSDG